MQQPTPAILDTVPQFPSLIETMSEEENDRRGAFRVETNAICSMVVGSANTAAVPARLLDISLTGARIGCESDLSVGQQLRLHMDDAPDGEILATVIREIGNKDEDDSRHFGVSVERSWPPEVFYALAFPEQLLTEVDQSKAATSVPEGWQPLEGYQFVRPIGKGGSGQVFEVRSPGGFAKAVKRIPLRADSPMSIRELLGYRLIRAIRHPYLLSIERLSIIGSDLMVVMELADESVHDEFLRYSTSGRSGIPRKRLLQILHEAAEVLDVLNMRFHLQHLDVKPENLFLVAGHLKLGDFGLLRQTDGETLGPSLNAVTPAYAAPEMLEGRCSATSDQYSLAVVYMELLTGRRPYKGNEFRQIAMQLLRSGPDLSALPEKDQSIVAKALSRQSDVRFRSCMEFVQALELTGATEVVDVATELYPPIVGARTTTQPALHRIETGVGDETNSMGMRLTSIPAGAFLMGSPDTDRDAAESEKPIRQVEIGHAFLMSVFAITQEIYERVMGSNPSGFRAGGKLDSTIQGLDTQTFPVEHVSWFDAVTFCNRLSEKEGLAPYYGIEGERVSIRGGNGYRLPTEAEWERACRGGQDARWSFGDDAETLDVFGWYRRVTATRPSPVGLKQPNGFGLYDMHGNVSEWCWDWFDKSYYHHGPERDPTGPEQGVRRVLRGGSFADPAAFTRSAYRHGASPTYRASTVGFRIARSTS